ncbi:MAG: hypothetical protein GX558_08530, partial [Clostridiales bacterium]|nr:hypothetical protein [Clostridiales bacterium]
QLIDRARAGATLYLSSDGGLIDRFRECAGLAVAGREERHSEDEVEFAGERVRLESDVRYTLREAGAQVLARNRMGEVAFSANRVGEGRVFYLNYPIERLAATLPGVVGGGDRRAFAHFYRAMAIASSGRVARCDARGVTLTEHAAGEGERLLALRRLLRRRRRAAGARRRASAPGLRRPRRRGDARPARVGHAGVAAVGYERNAENLLF